jgi:WD40 repeat protein
MARFREKRLLAGCFVLVSVLPAHGQGLKIDRRDTDRYGDPLPACSIGRLGTVRLRHNREVESVAISPDGRTVASAAGVVKVWDVATGKEIERFKKTITGDVAAFSLDGKVLLTATGAQTIQHWDVDTGRQLRDTTPKQQELHDLFRGSKQFFSSDRKVLVQVDHGGKVRFLDVDTGKRLVEMNTLHGFTGIALSHNGKTLANGDANGFIHLWDMASGKEISRLGQGNPAITTIPFSSKDWIYAVQFTADDQVLAAATPAALKLWDVATGKQLLQLSGRLACPTFSPDGKVLATSEKDAIDLWDRRTGKRIRRLQGHGSWLMPDLVFSRDGKMLASASRDHTVGLWDTATGKPLQHLEGHRGAVITLAFSLDSRSLASGGDEDHTLISWDLRSHLPHCFLSNHADRVWCATYSPDGKTIATGDGCFGTDDREAQIRLWDANQGRLQAQFFGHLNSVQSVVFSPDGKTLASSGWDARTRLWEATAGKRLFQIRGADIQKTIAFSPDGKYLLVANNEEGGVALFRAATASKLRDLGPVNEENRKIHYAAFVHTSQQVVTVETRRVLFDEMQGAIRPDYKDITEVRFWDIESGRRLRTVALALPENHTAAHVISPDGKLDASFGYSPREPGVELWDTDSGKLLTLLRGHTGSAASAAFSPDGKMLATGSWDTTVLLWDVPRLELIGLWHQLNREPAISASAVTKLTSNREGTVTFLKERLREAARQESHCGRWIADLDSDQFEVRERASQQLNSAGEGAVFALRLAMQAQQSPEARHRIQQALMKHTEALEEKIRRLIPQLDENPVQALRQIDLMGCAVEPTLRRILEQPPVDNQRSNARFNFGRARFFLQEALNRLHQPITSSIPLTPEGALNAIGTLERIGNTEACETLEEIAKGQPTSVLSNQAKNALQRLEKNRKADGR